MTPPWPPCLVDIRFTASRAQRMEPVTLTAITRWMRSADISSTRTPLVPTIPPLLTSAPSVPNASAALNNARMSLSSATSHFTAMALPLLAAISATTSSAAVLLLASPTTIRKPRAAAAIAVARPMPRLPPVMTTTLSVTRASIVRHAPSRKATALAEHQRSEIEHQARRIFQALLDADKEGHGFLAVDDAVIVGQRQIHHRADLDLAADDHRPLLDLVHAENAGLRRVQDRGRHQRAVDAAVRDGEGAALHLVDLELAIAGAAAEIGDALLDVGDRLVVAVAHHGHNEALVGADGDADVIVVLVDQIGAVDLGVDGRDVLQTLHDGLGEEAHEAEL